jgi:hypothetical protein
LGNDRLVPRVSNNAFEVDPLRHISLLEGLDPSALTLKSLPLIEASEDQSQLD